MICKRITKIRHLTRVHSTPQAPPGYGVVIEVADLRLRRSRRCAASRVLVQAGLSAQQSRIRPLVRCFLGWGLGLVC